MFFYKENPPVDAWAGATVFTDNFDQPITEWQNHSFNGGSHSQENGKLKIAVNFPAMYSLELLNSNFTSTNLTDTKATRIQVKTFISSSDQQLQSDNDNWASIRLRSTYNSRAYVESNGYKIIFKREGGVNGVNKIQFMTSNDNNTNWNEQYGGTRYDIGTYDNDTWYNMRIDTFPTATTEVVRVYKEATLDSGIWMLLCEHEYALSSFDSPEFYPTREPKIYLHAASAGKPMRVLFDDFKAYIMNAPATVPPV